MNKSKWILLVVTLGLISATGALLHHLKMNQHLGVPGIKASSLPGTTVVQIDFPERVLDFTSTNLPQAAVVTNMLPKDTSYALRMYSSTNDQARIQANIILMGKDRSSIHKPEYCLPGQGFRIDSQTNVMISIAGPQPYQMPVAKWTLSIGIKDEHGQTREVRGLYVFWFVADQEQTTDHRQRMWWLARDLLRHGVLQRWAYISYFTECYPGQEDATFERMRQLIAASVPEFQLPPKSAEVAAMAKP